MAKKGVKVCPHCDCEVKAQNLERHIRRAHPRVAAKKKPRTAKKKESKMKSKRRQEALDKARRDTRKKAGIAAVLVVILVLVAALAYYYWPEEKGNRYAHLETSKGTIVFELFGTLSS